MYASAYAGGGATASFAQVSGTPRKGYTGIIQGLYYTGGTPLGNIIGLFRRGTPRRYIIRQLVNYLVTQTRHTISLHNTIKKKET